MHASTRTHGTAQRDGSTALMGRPPEMGAAVTAITASLYSLAQSLNRHIPGSSVRRSGGWLPLYAHAHGTSTFSCFDRLAALHRDQFRAQGAQGRRRDEMGGGRRAKEGHEARVVQSRLCVQPMTFGCWARWAQGAGRAGRRIKDITHTRGAREHFTVGTCRVYCLARQVRIHHIRDTSTFEITITTGSASTFPIIQWSSHRPSITVALERSPVHYRIHRPPGHCATRHHSPPSYAMHLSYHTACACGIMPSPVHGQTRVPASQARSLTPRGHRSLFPSGPPGCRGTLEPVA